MSTDTSNNEGMQEPDISNAMCIIHSRFQETSMASELRSVTRGTRVTQRLNADVVISTVGASCAFLVQTNFSYAHVTDTVQRAERLASGFERSYVLLVRPNTDALHSFQMQLSSTCDVRPLLVGSESDIVWKIRRLAQAALDPAAKTKRRDYYKQVHEEQRSGRESRRILAELLKQLDVPDWELEADLLLDAFGSIRGVCLQPLSALLADCPVAGDTARALHAFFNEKPDPPLPCAMCPGEVNGCRLLPSPSQEERKSSIP